MDRSRFTALLPDECIKGVRVVVVGCGTLGSHTALTLARLGVERFTLVDHDVVGVENIATQAFGDADISKSKVDALMQHLCDINPGIDVAKYQVEFDTSWKVGKKKEKLLVFAVTDNIESRRTVWQTYKDNANLHAFFDARMGGEQLDAFAIKPGSPSAMVYEKCLEDTNYTPARCGMSSIPYTGPFAAACLGSLATKALRGVEFEGNYLGHMGTMTLERFNLARTA